MSTTITISLDTRRAKKDGTYPIIMRLAHQGLTMPIPLDLCVEQKYWDEEKRIIKKSCPGPVTRMNNEIQKRKADATDIILKSEVSGLSIHALKEKICANGSISFFTYSDELIERMKAVGKPGNARCYQGVTGAMKSYLGGKDLKFDQITYNFLTKFETHFLGKGNAINGLSVYMRTVRAVYNKAIKEGKADKEQYPFNDYKIKSEPTQKRAIDKEYLNNIIGLTLEKGHPCFNARNYFVASYMMYGMNFTDMAHLKRSDNQNGRIIYRRSKTKKIYDIKVTPALDAILAYYKHSGDYVFPILKTDTILTQEKEIQWARKRYNKKLKVVAEMCGIETNLTSYVSRHSFATQALFLQVPLVAISTMLGHSSTKTTEIYLKGLPSNVLDDYNSKILQW